MNGINDIGTWNDQLQRGIIAHPRCPGCGHNYFNLMPVPTVNGKAVKGNLCQWCIKEEE